MGRKSCALTLTLDRDKCEMIFPRRPGDPRRLCASLAICRIQGAGLDRRQLQINFEARPASNHHAEHAGLLMEACACSTNPSADDGGAGEEEEDVLLDS